MGVHFETIISGFRILLTLIIAVSLQSCSAPTRSQLLESRLVPSNIEGRIVVYPHFPCLSDKIGGQLGNPSTVMSASTFADALYPWFEPKLAPTDPQSIERLLMKPYVREKIREIDVQFLIGIASVDEADGFNGFFCGAGYAGMGCLGVGWENKQTSLEALVWNFRNDLDYGITSVQTTGESLFVGLGIPLVFVANTKDDACAFMADEIVSSLIPAPTD